MSKAANGMHSDSQAINENSNLKINLKCVDQKSCLSILLVDYEFCSLEVSKQILEMKGNFRVDNAASVDEAIKKMETQCYDVRALNDGGWLRFGFASN